MEAKKSNGKAKMLKRLMKRKVGLAILSVQALLTIILTILLIKVKLLKPLYIAAIFAVLLIFLLLMVIGQSSKGKTHYPLKVVSSLICILLFAGCFYTYQGFDTLKKVTNSKVTDEFQAIVLVDNPAETVKDVKDDEFGIDITQKGAAFDAVKTEIEKEIGQAIATKEYVDSPSLVDALYDKDCNVIILNSAVLSDVEENHPDFAKETKVIGTFEHVTETENLDKVENITQEPFSIFLSGIDTYGDISNKSRSDVNIIATVNPKTKEILLTSTPRDYFVQTTVSGTLYDKLTHAGLYGVDCSVGTLEKLYGVDINYYAKVNFTGFETIIDALGGVTVQSDYTFTAQHGEQFVEGNNSVDGKKALAFVRERHAFPSGDLQRNKNQQALIKAVIQKAASPAILTGFSDILNAVKDSVVTNLTYDEISALVKMQLDDGSSWHISTFGVSGKGGKSTTYSNQKKAGYVMYINEELVKEASGYINQVINGQVPTIKEK